MVLLQKTRYESKSTSCTISGNLDLRTQTSRGSPPCFSAAAANDLQTSRCASLTFTCAVRCSQSRRRMDAHGSLSESTFYLASGIEPILYMTLLVVRQISHFK